MKWNGRALLTPTSALRVRTQRRGRAYTSPLGCQDSHMWWGHPHSWSSPTPMCSKGRSNPSLGENPSSERMAGGIICLGCRQT